MRESMSQLPQRLMTRPDRCAAEFLQQADEGVVGSCEAAPEHQLIQAPLRQLLMPINQRLAGDGVITHMKLACTAMADPMQACNRVALFSPPVELLAEDVERMFCSLQPQHRCIGLGEQLADLRAIAIGNDQRRWLISSDCGC